jgi:hypothetical protein
LGERLLLSKVKGRNNLTGRTAEDILVTLAERLLLSKVKRRNNFKAEPQRVWMDKWKGRVGGGKKTEARDGGKDRKARP